MLFDHLGSSELSAGRLIGVCVLVGVSMWSWNLFLFFGREWFWKFVVLFGVDTHVVVDALWYVIVHDDRQLLSFSKTRVSFDYSFVFLGRYCL